MNFRLTRPLPLPITRRNVPLAQLVEQLTFNQWVSGSNPARLTTVSKSVNETPALRTLLYFGMGRSIACRFAFAKHSGLSADQMVGLYAASQLWCEWRYILDTCI